MHYSLIPFAGSCLSLYLIGTLMMTVAFVLDKKNPPKFAKVATALFCGRYLFNAVASVRTLVAFFIYFTNGSI